MQGAFFLRNIEYSTECRCSRASEKISTNCTGICVLYIQHFIVVYDMMFYFKVCFFPLLHYIFLCLKLILSFYQGAMCNNNNDRAGNEEMVASHLDIAANFHL